LQTSYEILNVFPQLCTFFEADFKASPRTSLQTTDAIKVIFVNVHIVTTSQ